MGDAEKKIENLIPGLPDEIAMECMVRVPYEFHSSMKSVCHSWRNLISHASFYQERRKSGKAEHLVCLVQPLPPPSTPSPPPPAAEEEEEEDSMEVIFDEITRTNFTQEKEDQQLQREQQQQQQIYSPPQYGVSIYNATQDRWQRIRPKNGGIPMFCECVAIPSSGKLLLLGGWDPNTLQPVNDVYILDFTGGEKQGSWRRGAPMSVPRSFFACAVVGHSSVYVAGGHDNQKNALRSAEVYDVEKDEWKMLPEMAEGRDECKGLSWEGDGDFRFCAVSGYGTENQGEFKSDAECYDPVNGCWSKIEKVWPFRNTSPRGTTTAVNFKDQCHWWWFLGTQQQQHEEIKEFEDKEKNWKLIANSIPIPSNMIGSSTFVTSIDYGKQKKNRVLAMGGGGRGLGDEECKREGSFIMERDTNNGNTKWSHVHTPLGFSAFPFSASYILI